MELNKPLIRKIIRKIQTTPQAYDQETFGAESDKAPCGTAACIAGWACVLSGKYSPKTLIAKSLNFDTDQIQRTAKTSLGLSGKAAGHLFSGEPAAGDVAYIYNEGWPQPFNRQWSRVTTARGRANVAVRLLKAILKTNGKILESER